MYLGIVLLFGFALLGVNAGLLAFTCDRLTYLL